jgi:hypothetical protein
MANGKAIKTILDCINSESDTFGNRYWAFRYTDVATGRQVCGMVSGGESNISAILRYMPGTNKDGFTDWDSVYYTRHEMKKREFRRLTADWQYAGCRPEDELVPFILRGLEAKSDDAVVNA